MFSMFIVAVSYSQVNNIRTLNNNAVNTPQIQVVPASQSQLDSLKKQIQDLQKTINQLKTEIAANYKLLDYSFGQLKKNYESHYHGVSTLRVTGFIQNNLGVKNASYKLALVSYGNDHTTETGKPLQKE